MWMVSQSSKYLLFISLFLPMHLVFQPDPSVRDIENQTSYQTLFRDQSANIEPFVGLIIGPYDIRMPSEESIFSIHFISCTLSADWFYVKNTSDTKGCPMNIDFQPIEEDSIPESVELKLVIKSLYHLVTTI